MNCFLVDRQVSHHIVVLPRSIRRFFGLESATQRDLCTPAVSTYDNESRVAESGLHLWPKGQHLLRQHTQQFFLKSCCFSGSALAINGLGLRSRKPRRLNNRWHCLTPSSVLNCFLMKWESILPSQRLPSRPCCEG
jgi:hypothetical protein